MNGPAFMLIFSLFVPLVSAYYVRPVVTRALINQCNCGFIVPVANCTSVFHTPEMECGMMSVVYTTANYPACSQAYVTCTTQGPTFQSIGVVGKVKNRITGDEDWSLLTQRKVSTNVLILTCKGGMWVKEDLEANPFVRPLEIQCASGDAAEAFDYYVAN